MHIKAKKSLGQNFLIDREVLEKIVSITDISNKEVLEIGPGSGNLTTYILKQKPKKFYVVEKDDELATLLKEKFDSEIENIVNWYKANREWLSRGVSQVNKNRKGRLFLNNLES